MRSRLLLVVPVVCGLIALSSLPWLRQLQAQQRTDDIALTGLVTAADEGPLEGVLVGAKKTGSTITTTVVTDQSGRYRFPRARLEPGKYDVRIRATGYDLDAPSAPTIVAAKTTTADLKLRKAKDVAAQLSNAEWLASFPGTDAQKASIRGCTHCHTLERVARTKYTADQFVAVIERMSTYPQLSFPMKIQKLVAPRIGGGPISPEQQHAAWRRQAEYLATINLSAAPQWNYQFKILPRPTGKATQVIYTEYDLPQRTRQPHDVIVDSTGTAWYASFGEQILGKLDPKTGQIIEYEIPTLKEAAPTGILGVRFDRDENPWLGMQFQGGIAKFDRKTETFETWSLPPDLNGPHVQINQVSPDRAHVDGRVWLQDAGTYTVLRLDPKSGRFDVFEPYKIPRPNVYDVIPDSKNNGYFLVLGAEDVGRIDAKSGDIKIFKTPTARSGPRRGMMDAQDRLWFGENNGDRIGMFDTRTEKFQEWPAPTPGFYPYDVTADKNGNVWSGGEYNDRILRLDPATGRFIEYALPRATNVRRVFVDNRTTPVTFWVGNNHAASIVRLEPLDAPAAPTDVGASIYEGARLIAGDGTPPVENSAFVVSGDRITQVGKKGGVEAAGARHVDLTGKTVMPALVDAHVHLGYRRGTTFTAANYTRGNLLEILDRLAYYGVAAVLEAGTGRGELPFQVRDEPRAGTRYLTAGRGFAMPGAGPGVPMRDAAYGVTTEADAREKVRELAAHKPDLIKIWVDDRNGTVEKLKPNLYRAIIDEAHTHGVRVMAHIAALDDAKDLLRAGVDGFAHCVRDRDVDAELIAMLKQRPNVFFLETMWGERNAIYGGPPAWLDDAIVRETMSAAEIDQLRNGFLPAAAPATLQRAIEDADRLLRNVAALHKAGVKLGLGTDTGGVSGSGAFGLASHVEMELMVKAGLTPAQAIVAATRTSAEILELDGLGTLAPGKSADFLVLDANPLDAIGNTRRISTVYMRGVEVSARRSRKSHD
ncbi:MAG TPA: amidohydrolase family protein [Vicinamibacterales bacterium]|nr:amidohydrolase family protein [Vicinamibacterales bacterium]